MFNKKGQISGDIASNLIIGVISLLIAGFVIVLGSGMMTTASASNTVVSLDDVAYNAAANASSNIAWGSGINLATFSATNSTNATNVVGTGNYSVTQQGVFNILSPQFASQPINLTYTYNTNVLSAQYNASQAASLGLSAVSGQFGTIGMALIFVTIIGVIIGATAWFRSGGL